jgi:RHS repeat-associated protein
VGATTQARTHHVDAQSNRLLALDNPLRNITHDAAGNTDSDLSSGVGWRTFHDAAGRLAGLSHWGGGGVRTDVDFGYDARGQRVFKRLRNGPGTIFVHDLEGRLLGEYDAASGAVRREYVWLQGMPVALVDGPAAAPQIYYVHADHQDTPRVVIDRNGAQRWSWVAEPFGHSAPVEDPLGLGRFVLDLRMPGQYFDAESGLVHNWHRDYDASVARYVQSDPIGLQGGINTYSYANGNPVSYADPTGELAWFIPAIIAGGISGYGASRTISGLDSCVKACEMTHGDQVKSCGTSRPLNYQR